MKSINCIIVDDEPVSRDILRKYIGDISDLELKGEFKDAFEANQYFTENTIDLMFLDINMPRLSGISFARSLAAAPMIIFTTAYPEYAVEGFELNAVDYLVKPFSFERFLKAVNRAVEKRNSDISVASNEPAVLIKSEKKIYSVKLTTIQYIEGCGDYIKVKTDERMLIAHGTIKRFVSVLPADTFLRIHKSYAVNVPRVDFIEGNTIHVSGSTIQVSSGYKEKLLEMLGQRD